jgi:hypothetical protein
LTAPEQPNSKSLIRDGLEAVAAASVVGSPDWTLDYGVPTKGPLNPQQPALHRQT